MNRSKSLVRENIKDIDKKKKMENKAFQIDRPREDDDVVEYQKTGNIEILDKLYHDRVPTLQFWTSHYYYLMDNSKEDMFSEFRNQFMKAVVYYDKSRGHFNTCLYTFIKNCIKNLLIGKNAKKRRPEGVEFDFNNNFIVPLDRPHEGKDGNSGTLMDVIASQMEDCSKAPDKIELRETLNILSKEDSKIRGYLKKISDGATLANLIKECKTVTGSILIDEKNSGQLKTKKGVTKLIRINGNIADSFKLLDYHICEPLRINYKIEMRKSKDADLFLKTLRRLRRNKTWYMEAIKT